MKHLNRALATNLSLLLIVVPTFAQNATPRHAMNEENFLPNISLRPPQVALQPDGPIMSSGLRSTIVPSRSLPPGAVFFQSGFEEDWTFGAPPGWTGTTSNSDSSWHRNDYTTGWLNASGFVSAYVWSFMGGFSARFHTAGTPVGRRGSMTTPNIDLSSATDSVFLSFWWTNSTGVDNLNILLSTDGGATFPTSLGFVGPTGNPWFRAIGYIPTHSATTRIKFEAVGDGGSTDILLDEVAVYQKGSGYSEFLTLPGTFSSFTDAARRLAIFGVIGPTIITVAAGTYADSVTFPPIPGSSFENAIAFQAAGSVTVQRGGVLTASTVTVGATAQRADDATISLWGADNMVFDGIGVSDRPGSTQNDWGYHIRALIPTDGATSNTIIRCTIVMNRANASTNGIIQETYWVLTSPTGANSNNKYLNNNIRSCTLRGIALDGYAPFLDADNEIGSVSGGLFQIFDIGGPNVSPSAVQVSAQNGVRVHGLMIDSLNVVSTSLPAIFVGGNTTIPDSVMNFEISGNVIHRIINSGVDINGVLSAIRVGFSSTLSSTAFVGKIYNNISYDYRAPGTRPDGIVAFYHQATPFSQVEWYNNTVLVDNQSPGVGGGSFVFRITSGTATVRNNVFINNSVQSGSGTNYVFSRVGGTFVTSNNDLFVDTTLTNRFIGTEGGFDYRTLAQWQASAPGRDVQSVYEFPHFVNGAELPYDLHIVNSFTTRLESGGVILTAVTTDIDGNPRYPNPGYPLNPLFPPTAPDIGADEFGGIPLDLTPPTITYTLLSNTTSTSNRTFGSVAITDASGINTASGSKPRVYYKKSTNANTLAGNTSSANGWKFVEAAGTSSPFSFTIDNSLLFPNGAVGVGDIVQYLVVAQDLISPPNVAINAGTFAATPSSVALTTSAFPIGGSINSYLITSNSYNGSYNAGSGQSFTSLTNSGGLFAALNGGVVTGNITANITSDLQETGTNPLNALSEEGGTGFSVLIRPSGGVRTISGTKDGALIDLNGADRITINGNISGVMSLILRNRSAGANASTILLRGDATGDTITRCIIEGAGTGNASGTILFGSATLGNRSNTISSNEIRDRSDSAGVPTTAVYSASTLNSANTITNDLIYNWTGSGVTLGSSGAGNGWTIRSNSFYQTATRSTPLRAISIESGSRHTVSGNSIGGAAFDRGGSPMTTSFGLSGATSFAAIFISGGSDSATRVSSNVIANISCPSSAAGEMTGIDVAAGYVTVAGNIIGGAGTPWDTVNARTDVPGAIRNTGGTLVSIDSNLITDIRTRDSLLFGISTSSNKTTGISSNVIHDLATSSTTGLLNGIFVSGPSATVSRNTVFNLQNTSTGIASTIAVAGMYLTGGTSIQPSNLIRGNQVYALNASGTGLGLNSPRIWGLYVVSGNPVVAYNNMIALGNGVVGDPRIIGIEDAGNATNKWYYNSVSVTGQQAIAGSNGTIAFSRTGAARDTLRDNIFFNTRTRGSRAHVALANDNASNWNAASSNYNLFYSSSPDSVNRWLNVGYSLAGWRANSGGDAQSAFGNPLFVSATDLHIVTNVPSPANNTATPIPSVTTDFDGDLRSATTPDIGADEFNGATSVEEGNGGAPLTFRLEQNYPNPFNPSTRISYQLPAQSHVILKVFDVLGREVAMLVNGVEAPGYKSVQWNAHAVSSGVYYYRLQAGEFTQTKKLILLK
jgi:hypothetical protein